MKGIRWLVIVVAALLLGGTVGWSIRAGSARQAERIVRAWMTAQPQAAFTATEIARFRVGGKLVESEALVAQRPQMRRIQYLTPPLKGVTIWRDHEQTYNFDPKGRQLEIFDKSRRHHNYRSQKEALALRNYQPILEGLETVAGRPAYRILLAPRHPGDAWERVWIDRATSVRLGDEDFDGDNHLLRSTRFTQIRFNAVDPDQFRPPGHLIRLASRTYSDEAQTKSVADVSRAVGFPIRLPGYLPPGYVFSGAYTYPCQCGCNQAAAQVCWSNGLKTISMFECSHQCDRGATCSFSRDRRPAAAQTSVDGKSFLFVGETSYSNLQKMLHSLGAAGSRPSQPSRSITQRAGTAADNGS
jgi:outer membrane lipoprotein-sorting protein